LQAAFELPQLFNRSPEDYAPISLDKDTYLDTRGRKLERQDKSTGALSFTLKRKRNLGGEDNDGEDSGGESQPDDAINKRHRP
jgi:hypothetical protein